MTSNLRRNEIEREPELRKMNSDNVSEPENKINAAWGSIPCINTGVEHRELTHEAKDANSSLGGTIPRSPLESGRRCSKEQAQGLGSRLWYSEAPKQQELRDEARRDKAIALTVDDHHCRLPFWSEDEEDAGDHKKNPWSWTTKNHLKAVVVPTPVYWSTRCRWWGTDSVQAVGTGFP